MNTLENWLLEQSRSARDLYLMLESDGHLDERIALGKERGPEQYRSVYAGTVAGPLAHSGPFLFRIDTVDHPLVQALLDSPECNWGWLASASHVDLDVLTRHWRDRLITGARPSLAVYRVHDNRVLGRALAHLKPEQRPGLLGPLASVCYWHAQQWTVADNPDPKEHPVPDEAAWLHTPSPEMVYANVQFDNARRYLVREHSQALAAVASVLNVDDWLWGLLELGHLWGWQQPEQVHFLLTRCLHTPGYLPRKFWEPKPGEEPVVHFERVYQQVLYWQEDAPV